jgi:Flp pilus assembly protein TadD
VKKALFLLLVAGAIAAGPRLALGEPADQSAGRVAFLDAKIAEGEGNFQQALASFRKAVADLPEDPVVHYEYAVLLHNLNITDKAREEASTAVRLDSQFADAWRLLGNIELRAADKDPSHLDTALEDLTKAHTLAPQDAQTAASLARALISRGRTPEAVEVLQDVSDSQNNPAFWRLYADALSDLDPMRAESFYDRLLEVDPDDRDALAAAIDFEENHGLFDEAVARLKKFGQKEPNNPGVQDQLALDLYRGRRLEDAEQAARAITAKRPEDRAVWRTLASILFETGREAEAESILRRLVREDAEDIESRFTLVFQLVGERRYSDARSVLEEVEKQQATGARKEALRRAAVANLGYIDYLEKKYEAARARLEPMAIQGSDVQDRAVEVLLETARDTEDAKAGLALAERALKAEPDNPDWQAAVAEFEIRAGQKAEGEKALQRLAAGKRPDAPQASADAAMRLKDYGLAVSIAREARTRFPRDTGILFRLGAALERSGRPEAAAPVFQELLKIRPRDAQTLNYLGYMWADRGEHLPESLAMAKKAVEEYPRNGAYLDTLGWAYFRTGDLDNARKYLRRAEKLIPDDSTIQEHVGDLLDREGDRAGAVARWQRALTLKPDEPAKIEDKLRRARQALKQE